MPKCRDGLIIFSEMNSMSIKEWFFKILSLLEGMSYIVMYNTMHYMIPLFLDKVPSTNTRKIEIIEWLVKNNILFSPCETEVELINKVKPIRNN